MSAQRNSLTPKSEAILDLIAKSHSYEQILGKDLSLTYIDIFNAAREAVYLLGRRDTGSATQLDKIRKQHPRAYEIWTPEEDARLSQSFHSGETVEEISWLTWSAAERNP